MSDKYKKALEDLGFKVEDKKAHRYDNEGYLDRVDYVGDSIMLRSFDKNDEEAITIFTKDELKKILEYGESLK